jgi:D-alanyl-D-alanine carboxypeptidase
MNNQKYYAKLTGYIDKLSAKKYDKSLFQILIHSDKYGIDIKKSNIDPDTPFHVASVGKMFTATLVGILADEKLLSLDDKISQYLASDVLDGLFVHKGTDYQKAVTVRDLLGHYSGIADYFESDVHAGSKFVDIIMKDADKKWTPASLLAFTRDNQTAFGAPGEFHYSDTGYILLGLLVEAVTKTPFDKALSVKIFEPLGMKNSYLMFYGHSERAMAPIWFDSHEISQKNMLSCDWAGGGIVSTLDDLLLFQKAYWSGGLISEQFVGEMSAIKGKFRAGMHYGLGMMELRFDEFFFLLRGLPRPLGHSGILSTFMFYDRAHDTHFILNMGSNHKLPDGVRVYITVESMLKKIYTN